MFVIHFSFKFKKRLKKVETKFLGCLILWEQSGDGFSFFFEKNAYHTTPGSFSFPKHNLQYISVTSGFTRLSMKTKYVFRSLISLYVNFHSNRTM